MMNPLRKKKLEIIEEPTPAPRPEEAGKRWAIEARGIKKSFKAGQMMVDGPNQNRRRTPSRVPLFLRSSINREKSAYCNLLEMNVKSRFSAGVV